MPEEKKTSSRPEAKSEAKPKTKPAPKKAKNAKTDWNYIVRVCAPVRFIGPDGVARIEKALGIEND